MLEVDQYFKLNPECSLYDYITMRNNEIELKRRNQEAIKEEYKSYTGKYVKIRYETSEESYIIFTIVPEIIELKSYYNPVSYMLIKHEFNGISAIIREKGFNPYWLPNKLVNKIDNGVICEVISETEYTIARKIIEELSYKNNINFNNLSKSIWLN